MPGWPRTGLGGLVMFSDPVPRCRADGTLVMPGPCVLSCFSALAMLVLLVLQIVRACRVML